MAKSADCLLLQVLPGKVVKPDTYLNDKLALGRAELRHENDLLWGLLAEHLHVSTASA